VQLKEDDAYTHDGSKKFVLKCPKVRYCSMLRKYSAHDQQISI